jgi:mannosyl-oligosaccharide alpha-1,2-mannosidase
MVSLWSWVGGVKEFAAEKLNPSENQLPMYKDKPMEARFRPALGGGPRRKQRLIYGLIIGVLMFFVYRLGQESSNVSPANVKSWIWGKSAPPISWKDRQSAVKEAFRLSWQGYEKYAWGMDGYEPISKRSTNMGPKPLGWIIVDSLDTMHIMGLDNELARARKWVENELDYDMDYDVNVFETTIRMLGGLLSAHYLTKDDVYLDKAVDLGNRLVGAFDSPSGLPYASVNLHTRQGKQSHADSGASSTAEVATLQLEFKYLARLTGESLYWEKAEHVMKVIDDNHAASGLVPIFIRPDSGKFQGNLIRLGSRGDSYYEYLLKQYLQTNGQEPVYRDMYSEAVDGIKDHLISKSSPSKLTFIGELDHGIGSPLSNKMDHLVCFVGGMLALGATGGLPLDDARKMMWSTTQESDFRLGIEITRSCYETYSRTATGLGPEIVHFNTDPSVQDDFTIKPADAHNLQRPETIESLFILWRLTKNPVYREWGWKIFEAFEKWGLLDDDGGYSCLKDVRITPPPRIDNMESFWLSETLKYLYLLFDDSEDLLPLTDIVFNTEGHPFPRFSMEPLFKTGWTRS